MQIYAITLALCFSYPNVWGTTAFSIRPPKATSSVALKASRTSSSDTKLFPDLPVQRIEGGDTLKTFKMPLDCDRAELFFKTNGRPLKAKVELWLGPLRRVHFMDIDVEDGSKTPFHAVAKFKKAGQVLKVSTTGSHEFPMMCGVRPASPARSAEIDAFTSKIWEKGPKTKIQGGPVEGGPGAVRTFPIDPNVKSVQLVFWSRDTSKKSLKAKIEVLQGPNNNKQTYDLQCGGGSQPYHAVFQTPGANASIRIFNKKFVEDGLFEVAVIPYEVGDEPIRSPGPNGPMF